MKKEEVYKALRQAGFENAQNEANWLAEKFGADIPKETVKKRLLHYPLQYLLGEWDFYRETYEVSPDCLIPRADTELLVEWAIEKLPPNAVFADLCTGSGCVAISTLCARKDTTAVAVDFFENTLALAKRNAVRNRVENRVRFKLADVTKPPQGFEKVQAILSNPPYIRNKVVPTLQQEVGFEPQAALCGGEDGLDFYRSILDLWGDLLLPGGFFLFEIGYDQAEDLRKMAAERGLTFALKKDFGGNDRVVFLGKNE